VQPKRTGTGDEQELNGQPDGTPIMAGGMWAGVPHPQPEKKDEEKMSLFWRVFGGTILSIAALVAITVFNNILTSITELRAEVARANEARTAAVTELRTELAKAQEARGDLIRKDEFNSRLSNNWDRVQAVQQQTNAQNATLTSLKTELDGLKDRTARQAADGEAIRKDVAAMDLIKERLMVLSADLKGSREELAKVRGEVDRNTAQDQERRDRRDAQYKQIDEVLKELQKGLQDCREKLARLEGQYGPPSPVTPKKAAGPRGTPTTPEPAPMPGEPKKDKG
jgi:predicted nuclease with TOPRIM domain